jgi:hypothetical protein
MRSVAVVMAVQAMGCGFRHGTAGVGSAVADGAPGEALLDAPDAAVLGPWGIPTMVAIAPMGDDDPTLTGDLLELYFNRAGNIYITTRATLADVWATPVVVAELSTGAETTPEVTSDGLTIFISSGRAGGLGMYDIYMATRASRSATWNMPVEVAELSSAVIDDASAPSDDLLDIVLTPNGGADLAESTRAATGAPWATPALLGSINTASNESDPCLSSDRLTLYFDSNRAGTADLYIAHRASVTAPFDAPVPITEIDTASGESDPWVSPDGRHLFFTSDRGGSSALWESSR